MKKFWMLILAAVFSVNSGVATLWAEDFVPAVTETVEAVTDETLLNEEAVLEEEQQPAAVVAEKTVEAVEAAEEEALDDEFSDEMALEDDMPEGAMEDVTAGGLTADQKVY